METDYQHTLRESARRFAERRGDMKRARALRRQDAGYSRELAAEMASLGWFSILVPEEKGGLGLGVAEAAIIAEELGRKLIGEPLVSVGVLSAGLLASAGAAAAANLLPGIADGSLLASAAWQETAGADPLTAKAEAWLDGDILHLRGRKNHVPAAGLAHGFIVSAWLGGRLALLWVPAGRPGVVVDAYWRVDGTAAGAVTFDLELGRDALVSMDAAEVLRESVAQATMVCAAEMLGVMQGALDLTLDYLRTREQFGRKIGSFQALQHRVVDLFVQQELTRAVLRDAMRLLTSDASHNDKAALIQRLKARASTAAIQITREAVQMHGAFGFTDDCDVGLYLKRAMVLSAWLGNAQDHRRARATAILGATATQEEAS